MNILDEKLETIQERKKAELNKWVSSGPDVSFLRPGIISPKMQIPRKPNGPHLTHSPTTEHRGEQGIRVAFHNL